MKKYTAPCASVTMLETSDVITLSIIDTLSDWAGGIDISDLTEWSDLG
ncbi:MAG: hypothetical protein IJ011_04635 [Clostridia bacterium]|nr:hypothetical protein [Clostridia bacterium]